jgi:hypothetical protein
MLVVQQTLGPRQIAPSPQYKGTPAMAGVPQSSTSTPISSSTLWAEPTPRE